MNEKHKNIITIAFVTIAIVAVIAAKEYRNKSTVTKPTDNPTVAETQVERKADEQINEKSSETIDNNKVLPTLIELGSHNCTPCRMMMPIIEELKTKYESSLNVQFIDVWQDKNAAEKYRIRAIPTQIYLDAKGNEIFRQEGFFPKEDILKKWKELGIKLE